jgi:hypothetical protein
MSNTRYIVRNRHGFNTITTTTSSLEIFPNVPKNWEVASCDPDGEPWAWYREATEEEVAEWIDSGLPFGNWVEG